MKGFQRVVIENFQSHDRTEIDLTDGLNVFVGPSDSGKSAILRALRWLLYNQPRGSDFIRAGKDRCRVTLTLTNGVSIIRERTPSSNRYILRNSDGEEQVFEGFGGQVPLEVMEAHGMHPLKMDTDWNLPAQFGTQLEGPFLLSETGGVKAKSIGRISGAHIIDMALQSTVKDQKQLAAETRYLAQETERLDEALKPYADLPQLIKGLERSERIYAEIREKEEKLKRLQHLSQVWATCRQKQKETRHRIDSLRSLPVLEGRLAGIEGYLQRVKELERMWRRLGEQRKERTRTETILTQTAHCDQVEARLQELENLFNRLNGWRERQQRWAVIWRERTAMIRLREGAKQMEQIPLATMEEQIQRLRQLQRLSPRVRQLSRNRQSWERWMERTAHLPEQAAEEASARLERLRVLRQAAERYADVYRRLREGRRFYRQKEEEIEKGTSLLVDSFRRLGRCPTCGSPVNGDVLDHIMEEVGGGWSRAAAGAENQGDKNKTG
ncbi:AAA family ATPase [Desmospora activa]|uniref:Nuclease SbcCD subunit C n=1 Tax=Desmospora activa DSM 45169 TaxID=1121389 RepID=A0A2T4ZAJ2_9BACL|nr:AAA family ATPase [Desmospora activa]PTM58912.1 AAA domain-containing protein [Desmospora activa DSM 45169]